MNMHVPQISPAMGEFTVSNHLLGDQDALKAAWERDGYWFFRDVLDKAVIADIRQVYVDYLVEMGLTDPNDPEAHYNGADYAHLPINSNRTKMNERKVHKLLHDAPTINAFFTRLFGCDPFWVPFTVHRSNPPVHDRSAARLRFHSCRRVLQCRATLPDLLGSAGRDRRRGGRPGRGRGRPPPAQPAQAHRHEDHADPGRGRAGGPLAAHHLSPRRCAADEPRYAAQRSLQHLERPLPLLDGYAGNAVDREHALRRINRIGDRSRGDAGRRTGAGTAASISTRPASYVAIWGTRWRSPSFPSAITQAMT